MLVDPQRRQRERDQRGDAVAHGEVVGGRVARADLPDPADEHAARAGDRVVHLAALPDDAGHLLADAGRVAPTASEICLKQAESMLSASTSMDELVVAERQVRVEPVGALGEHAGGGDHAPQSIGVHGGPRLSRDFGGDGISG